MHLFCYEVKQPNLKLKKCRKQLLGSLSLDVNALADCYWLQNSYNHFLSQCSGIQFDLFDQLAKAQT